MVTNKTIYELYYAFNIEKIDRLKEEIQDTKNKLENVLRLLEPYTDELGELLDYYSFLAGNIKTISVKKARNNRQKLIKSRVEYYYKLFHTIALKKEEIKRIKDSIIEESIFNLVVTTFNEHLVTSMIEDRYSFIQPDFGSLEVVLFNSNKNKIDFGKSMKNKQALIEQGKVPYIKADAELAEIEGKKYEAEQWVEFHERNTHLYLQWNPHTLASYARIPNIKQYSFVAIKGKRGVVKQLVNYRNTLTDEQLNIYKRYE